MSKRRFYHLAIALILVGFAMLCQPFAEEIYAWGFPVLLCGVIIFMILDHLPWWSDEEKET